MVLPDFSVYFLVTLNMFAFLIAVELHALIRWFQRTVNADIKIFSYIEAGPLESITMYV